MGVITTINTLIGRGTWPPPSLSGTWEEIELFAALRSSNVTRLRQERSIPWMRNYLVSPVPRMVSRASANLLFGEPPLIDATQDADQGNLDQIVDENDLPAELHRAAVIASSEGEVWGRVCVDPSVLDVPIIEFVSRARVIPHFNGRFVAGATFVTTWETGAIERYRLFETYEAGSVTNTLYKGTTTALGGKVNLSSFEMTAGMTEQVLTGVAWPLVAFIPNTIDDDPERGYSDYRGLTDRFFAINEAATVGQHNLRLAGRKRALVDGKYLRGGRLPEGDDVFIRESRMVGDDAGGAKPLQMLEYEFHAAEAIKWADHLIDTTLTFAGVSPQAVGRQMDGSSISGTAMKLRMSHSLMEAAGKGRYFDRGIRRLLRGATVLDGRPISEGGFGRTYVDRDSLPAIERSSGLPRDDLEAAQMVAQLVAAESISLEQRVAFLHPDWSNEQVDEEVGRLHQETSLPALGGPIAAPASQE